MGSYLFGSFWVNRMYEMFVVLAGDLARRTCFFSQWNATWVSHKEKDVQKSETVSEELQHEPRQVFLIFADNECWRMLTSADTRHERRTAAWARTGVVIVPPSKGLVKKKTLRVSISISVHCTSVLYGYIVLSRPAARPSKGPAKGKLFCIHQGNKQSGEFCRQSFGSRCFKPLWKSLKPFCIPLSPIVVPQVFAGPLKPSSCLSCLLVHVYRI